MSKNYKTSSQRKTRKSKSKFSFFVIVHRLLIKINDVENESNRIDEALEMHNDHKNFISTVTKFMGIKMIEHMREKNPRHLKKLYMHAVNDPLVQQKLGSEIFDQLK